MGDKVKKSLDAIYHKNVRELLEAANELGIHKDSIVSIIQSEGSLYLIFEKTTEINPETPEESA